MGIKNYRPTSPGRRQMSVSDFSELTRSEPERGLLEGAGGRAAVATSTATSPRGTAAAATSAATA